MSGYLQRMAATAMMPQRRVHPFVEPVYGGRRDSEPASRPVETVVGELAPSVQRTRVEFAHPSHEGEAVTNKATGSKRVSDLPATGVTPRERFEALLPEVESEKASSNRMADFTERGAPRAIADGGEAARAQKWSDRRDDARTEEGWKFEPLMGEMSGARGRGAGNKAVVDFVEFSGSAQGKERPAVLHPTLRETNATDGGPGASGLRSAAVVAAGRRLALQQQARERAEQRSDEIQIHIGRIEVIAMPPAAPRPVAVPARKSQTLDEYLRRSSGRAG